MADTNLILKMELVPAQMHDFTHYRGALNPNQKNIGMQFVILNTDNQPELYRIGVDTNLDRVADMVNLGRAYIFKQIEKS